MFFCYSNNEIFDLAKDIGLGPALYLMTTKALIYLFFIILIAQIPMMMVFEAQSHATSHVEFNDWKINIMENYFYEWSLGHLRGEVAGEKLKVLPFPSTCPKVNDTTCFFHGDNYNKNFGLVRSPFNPCCDLTEKDIGTLMLLAEMFVIIVSYFFIKRMETVVEEYITLFKAQTIEMDDFCVNFKQLPKDRDYDGDETALQTIIEHHFESILSKTAPKEEDDSNTENAYSENPRVLEVSFGNFCKNQYKLLKELADTRRQVMELNKKSELTRAESKKKNKLVSLFKYKFEVYQEEYRGENKIDDGEKHHGQQSINNAYVVFKDMDDVDAIIKAYDQGACKRCCIRTCGSKEQKDLLNSKYIFKKWPVLDRAPLPEDIKWENLGYSSNNRRIRRCGVNFVAFILLLIALVVLAGVEVETDKMKETPEYK